jgi:hypothetical protein
MRYLGGILRDEGRGDASDHRHRSGVCGRRQGTRRRPLAAAWLRRSWPGWFPSNDCPLAESWPGRNARLQDTCDWSLSGSHWGSRARNVVVA